MERALSKTKIDEMGFAAIVKEGKQLKLVLMSSSSQVIMTGKNKRGYRVDRKFEHS